MVFNCINDAVHHRESDSGTPNTDAAAVAIQKLLRRREFILLRQNLNLYDARSLPIEDRPFNTIKEKIKTIIDIGIESCLIDPNRPIQIDDLNQTILHLIGVDG